MGNLINIQQQIEQRLASKLDIAQFQCVNESHKHATNSQDSHFNLLIVSDDFAKMSLLERHKYIYAQLHDVMPRIHALALHIYTKDEWQHKQPDTASPDCIHG